MRETVLLLMLLFAPTQASPNPLVNRVFIATPYNASIIFEYANVSIPEDQPLRDGAVDCLVSELNATGLFTDVHVTLKPIEGGRKVNIDIEPTWNPRRESFVIEEIILEGFTGIDEQMLRGKLRQKGLTAGTPLLLYPSSKIKVLASDIVQEMYQSAPQMQNTIDELLSDLSLRVTLVAPERVKLVIASGRRDLCQQ